MEAYCFYETAQRSIFDRVSETICWLISCDCTIETLAYFHAAQVITSGAARGLSDRVLSERDTKGGYALLFQYWYGMCGLQLMPLFRLVRSILPMSSPAKTLLQRTTFARTDSEQDFGIAKEHALSKDRAHKHIMVEVSFGEIPSPSDVASPTITDSSLAARPATPTGRLRKYPMIPRMDHGSLYRHFCQHFACKTAES